MKILILSLLVTLTIQASIDLHPFQKEWNEFKLTYNKIYNSLMEEEKRFKTFADNKLYIDAHNRRHELGLESTTLKINHFSDMSLDEFAQRMLREYTPRNFSEHTKNVVHLENVQIPAHYDWRNYGAVNPIKDQGYCGGCWAFATNAAIEGHTFIATGRLVSLSEQCLIDCSKSNNGCLGGWRNKAFQDVIDMGGVDSDRSYPFQMETSVCKFNPANVAATISDYALLTPGDEENLKLAVATLGPITVGVDAGSRAFQTHHDGIFISDECSSTELNHSLLVIGYGSENGVDYWLVKNSWSTKWGEAGFGRLARNRNNQCGIATYPVYPIV